MSVRIINGWFEEILEKPVRGNKFIFMPVSGDVGDISRSGIGYMDDERDYSTFPLHKYVEDLNTIFNDRANKISYLSKDVAHPIWVRGRIPAIFGGGIPLPSFHWNACILEQTFIACRQRKNKSWDVHVFICEDYSNGEVDRSTRLRFYKDNRYRKIYREIAIDFWSILLKEPDNIYPFCEFYYFFDGLTSYWCKVDFDAEYGFYDRILEHYE